MSLADWGPEDLLRSKLLQKVDDETFVWMMERLMEARRSFPFAFDHELLLMLWAQYRQQVAQAIGAIK